MVDRASYWSRVEGPKDYIGNLYIFTEDAGVVGYWVIGYSHSLIPLTGLAASLYESHLYTGALRNRGVASNCPALLGRRG